MMRRIKNVIVKVDYTEAGMNATRTAVQICRRHDANLHLLNIHDTAYRFPTAGMQAPVMSLNSEIIQGEIDNLNTYAAAVERDYGVLTTAHHEVGPFYSTIASITRSLSNSLLVVTNQKGTLFQNSTGFQALEASTCPVLVLNKKEIREFKNIVFPIRKTPAALEKLRLAYNMATRNKAKVYVIGALEKKDKAAGYAKVREMVRTASRTFTAGDLFCDYEIAAAKNNVQTVMDSCLAHSADLVVITASTMRSFGQLLSGNYAQKIIGNGTTAALCVKPGTQQRPVDSNFSFSHSMLV